MSDKENIITKTYDLLLYMLPQLEKFPRTQKFILADRIENHLLNILEFLTEAYYLPKNKKPEKLNTVNLKLEVTRYLIRLSFDMKYINTRRYHFISEKINEIGRMNGAWLKSVKQ